MKKNLLGLLLGLSAILPLSAIPHAEDADSLVSLSDTSKQTSTAAVFLPIFGVAENSEAPHLTVRRTRLYGIGINHLYDSYLSPLDYVGYTAGYTYLSERSLRKGGERITSLALFGANVTSADNPKKNAEFLDAEFEIGLGYHYNLLLPAALHGGKTTPRLRIAVGGMSGLHAGGTYSSRNGNNPAQGRLSADLSMSAIAEYRFVLWQRQWLWRTHLDIPLMGVMFSPHYGQSYYEIFKLGHTDSNLCFTHPFNAPSMRTLSTLSLPFGRNRFSLGFHLNYRQSHTHGLKRHAWNSTIVFGYTRTLKFLD